MANVNHLGERPASLVVAAAGALVLGCLVVAGAIASIVSGHGTFSGAIGGWLAIYGVAGIAAAWALWRRSVFGRGPVLTISALNLIVALATAGESPWAWVIAAGSAVTLVAVSLPATSRALHAGRLRPADAPPPSAGQGS